MCVKLCQCNSCFTKNTCVDCIHCDGNKDVDCTKAGIQNCIGYRPFGTRLMTFNRKDKGNDDC